MHIGDENMSNYRKQRNIELKVAEAALQTASQSYEYQNLHVLRRLETNGVTLEQEVTPLEGALLYNLLLDHQVDLVKKPYLFLFKQNAYALAPQGREHLRTERESVKQRIESREEKTHDLGMRLLILSGDFDSYDAEQFRGYMRSKQDITQRIKGYRESRRKDNGTDIVDGIDDFFDVWLFSTIDTSASKGFGGERGGGSFGGGGASALYDDTPSIPHIDPVVPTVGYAVGENIAETASVATETGSGVLDHLGDLASGTGEVIGNIASGTVDVLGDVASGATELLEDVLSNIDV